ncbi:MAG: penicillin-binding protein 2 [candidate division NC10 bacterium]|nr:penicillin-binding protein 2 [candidate division NC10 bacterium]
MTTWHTLNPAPGIQRRVGRLILVATAAVVVLVLRLWHLQVLEGDRYLAMARHNRLRLRPVDAPRGILFDRYGQILVDNRPSFDVYLVPEDVTDPERTAERLGHLLGMPAEQVAEKLAAGRSRPFTPLLLKAGVPQQAMVALEERKLDLPGVSLRIHPVRAYPAGSLAAHLLGYVSEVNQAQLAREEFRDFAPGEPFGQAGVERRFDAFIRGIDGGEQIEVDALGRITRLVERMEPQSGFNLVLTIDRRLQDMAEKAFAGKSGAVVAMDPRTGEILAWVSNPAYDPGLFTQRISREEWGTLAGDPRHPLQNRPLQGQYPPGSIFKLIVAAAALESGAITPSTLLDCPGSFALGNFTFDNWKREGRGMIDLRRAIAESCNTYFYQVALKTGIEPIVEMAREFGLGQAVGLGLGDEGRGLVPTPAWKQQVTGEPWYPGNTVITAIGQGMVLATPLQVLTMVSAIANGGTLYKPWVVKRVESWQGGEVEEYGPEILRRVRVSPETLRVIRDGMWGVVNDEQGTGQRSRVPWIEVAGKTATAQVVRKQSGQDRRGLKDHGWFVAYAPAHSPEIALVVIAENAGFGSAAAAPVARAILEAAFPLPTVDVPRGQRPPAPPPRPPAAALPRPEPLIAD